MRVDANVTHSVAFVNIKEGDGFLHSGKAYIKLKEFIKDQSITRDYHHSTAVELGGWNAVRLNDGQPGAFKHDTSVTPKRLRISRTRGPTPQKRSSPPRPRRRE